MNNCSFAGNITRDPRHGKSDKGNAWLSFTIAVNENKPTIDPETSEKSFVQTTTYIDIKAFGFTASNAIANRIRKGARVVIAGAKFQMDIVEKDGATFRNHYFVVSNNGEIAGSWKFGPKTASTTDVDMDAEADAMADTQSTAKPSRYEDDDEG